MIALFVTFLLVHLKGKHNQGNHGKGDRSGKRSFSVTSKNDIGSGAAYRARQKQAAAASRRARKRKR